MVLTLKEDKVGFERVIGHLYRREGKFREVELEGRDDKELGMMYQIILCSSLAICS